MSLKNMSAFERDITYLTPPRQVAMHDEYFTNASLDHFWIQRRFRVAQLLAGHVMRNASRVAEFGCGNGVVQRQFELAYSRPVDGFDLNEAALRHNISPSGGVYCYDVHDRRPDLQLRYDLGLLFDVLEHIEDEDSFLASLLFHLAPGARLIINVPAGQYLFSDYDRAQGHYRRYSVGRLIEVVERNHLRVEAVSYWGLTMVPVLLLRRLLTKGQTQEDAMNTGFRPPHPAVNSLLGFVSGWESVPHRIAGTSVMLVASLSPGAMLQP